jgi:hypothetical protein
VARPALPCPALLPLYCCLALPGTRFAAPFLSLDLEIGHLKVKTFVPQSLPRLWGACVTGMVGAEWSERNGRSAWRGRNWSLNV